MNDETENNNNNNNTELQLEKDMPFWLRPFRGIIKPYIEAAAEARLAAEEAHKTAEEAHKAAEEAEDRAKKAVEKALISPLKYPYLGLRSFICSREYL